MFQNIEDKIRGIFKSLEISYPEDSEMNLMEVGVDSVVFLKLVVDIEEKFNMMIPDEDLLYENFSTISLICKYLSDNLSTYNVGQQKEALNF